MKDLTAELLQSVQAEQIDVILFVELEFDEGTSRLNSTESDIPWNGYTWTGLANIAGISGVVESDELEATGFSGYLNAGTLAATALTAKFRGRPARLYFATRDADGLIVEHPTLLAAARMDKMPIKLGKEGRIELECVNRIADWQRVNSSRFTDNDQKVRFPSDRAFEFVSQTNEREVAWGPTS